MLVALRPTVNIVCAAPALRQSSNGENEYAKFYVGVLFFYSGFYLRTCAVICALHAIFTLHASYVHGTSAA